MNSLQILTQLLLYLLIILQNCVCSQARPEICLNFSCNPYIQVTIEFPFHVPRNQSSRCGCPGFDLTCGRNSQTILNLPKPLTVRGIDYAKQLLLVSDPNSCIPKQLLTLNLTSTPYSYGPKTSTYSFLNCSGTNITKLNPKVLPSGTSVVRCLSEGDYTVMTTFDQVSEAKLVMERKCKVIKRVNASFKWEEMPGGFYPFDMSDVVLRLSWSLTSCANCVANAASSAAGLSRSAKYGLMLGAGIPAIICMIALTYFIDRSARARNLINRRFTNTESSQAIFSQPVILRTGLDMPTIESYPKTILGESKRLPKTSDGTCPICLSEYQPKETLRSLPECNHYFHADCIDEWLRMNASCPLCRKSPQ